MSSIPSRPETGPLFKVIEAPVRCAAYWLTQYQQTGWTVVSASVIDCDHLCALLFHECHEGTVKAYEFHGFPSVPASLPWGDDLDGWLHRDGP